jgi:hypothetical protein
MRSPLARGAVALAAIAAVVVLFVVLAGGDDDGGGEATTTTQAQAATGPTGATGATGAEDAKPAQPEVTRIEVVDGKPRGGVQRLDVKSGERVRLVVESDVADEVHVHGYDLSEDVPAGGSVRFNFPAKLEGVFEIELEGRKQQIAELRVTP